MIVEGFPPFGLAGLTEVDGFGQLARLPGAAEFAQDAPGLKLGVCALAGAAQLGVSAVGFFREAGLWAIRAIGYAPSCNGLF